MNSIIKGRLPKAWTLRGIGRLGLAGLIALTTINAFSQATVTTLTDSNHGKAGYKDGNTFSQALFRFPTGIALDPSGTVLFLADCTNNAVRMITSIADKANSMTFSAFTNKNGISHPRSIAIDASTNIYVLNQGSGKDGTVLEFNGNNYINYNVVSLVATNASHLTNATSLALDLKNNLYVTVAGNTVIHITTNGTSTVVGVITNSGTSLRGIVVLQSGILALTDAGNNGIWLMDPANTNVMSNAVKFTGFNGAGDVLGPPAYAAFNRPENIVKAGNGYLVVADFNNNKVKVIDATGNVTRLYGVNSKYWSGQTPGWKDGTVNPNESVDPVQARQPYGLAFGSGGTLYVTEDYYSLLREATGTALPALPPPPPSAPSIYSVTTNYGQVTLTWSPISAATSYNVKRASDPNTNGPFAIIANTTSTTFTDTGVTNGTTYYYVVSALNTGGESPNSAVVTTTPPLPPVPDPQIGFASFNNSSNTSVFTAVSPSSADFNNDTTIVIKGTPLTQTFYSYSTDGSPPVPPANSVQSDYHDGLSYDQVVPYIVSQIAPTLIINAIGKQSGSTNSNSALVKATFNFITGNPVITGNNAAQFKVNDITSNAYFYYTTDGSDPKINPDATQVGPISGTNGITLSLQFPPDTNSMLFQIVAIKPNYQISSVVSQVFSRTNFVANTISFGFGSGEASSAFLGSPGQTFYAPVTMTALPDTTIYSLQFNLTVTNVGTAASITKGAFNFQSMLMKPIVPTPTNFPPGFNLYTPIQPWMFIADASSPPPPSQITNVLGLDFVNLETIDTNNNLLGVGWIERYSETNLYNTLSQTLTTYSMAHDHLFPNSQQPNGVIVGGYGFQIPTNAQVGQQYQIQIGRPSATDDGVGASGSSVYIAAPTNGATSGGSPINALKYVTVTNQLKYIAGSVYPFRWFNAGDFGSSNIVNADVEQVFQSAIYSLNYPPAGSDFFDGMDSCGNIGVLDSDPNDANNGSYTNTFASLNTAQLNALFNANDTTINQIAFGDGMLDVCDVYVTYRRSLDPSLVWFERYWNNGQLVADTNAPNVAAHVASDGAVTKSSPVQPKAQSGSTVPPQVNFTAGDITNCSPGQVVQIPITATIYGSYPLRVLLLNLTVEPLDGSPALTTPVQFTETAPLGSPYTTDSQGYGNYSAVWLNSSIAGLTGTVTLGTLTVTIPAGASANAAYAIHFDHASASPNGLASFPKQTLTGLVTLSSRTNSSYGDGIPDSWRLRWFGTVNNYLSLSNACPSGDGINNWKKYVAGVDPNTANDFPSTSPVKPAPPGSAMAIHWPTVSGKQYVIERTSSACSPAVGPPSAPTPAPASDMEFDDTSSRRGEFLPRADSSVILVVI